MAKSDTDREGGFASESDMIQCVFAPLAEGAAGAFGLLDDAALFSPRPGEEVVVTGDMLIEDRHFLPNTKPGDIAWKALAVNVSDLVAKGAGPDIYLLSIAVTDDCGKAWLEEFAAGLGEAQEAFGCHLAGGDSVTTPGALTISIAAFGRLPRGGMVHRSGAQPGDTVYVTGTIGDSVTGLLLLREDKDENADSDADWLVSRHRRPMPEPALAPVIREYANAAMDISDGLAGDFGKLCAASACGGTIEAGEVPLSVPVRAMMERGIVTLETLLSGGDDYCVLAAVPTGKCQAFEQAAGRAGSQAFRIGRIDTEEGVRILGSDGKAVQLSCAGFDHFSK